MTWYFWVWGIASSIGCLALVLGALVGAIAFQEWRKERKNAQEAELFDAKRWRLRALEAEAKVNKVNNQLAEMRKETNTWGKISP